MFTLTLFLFSLWWFDGFRVLGLSSLCSRSSLKLLDSFSIKLIPAAINIGYFAPFSLWIVYFLVLYSEEYFNRIVEKFSLVFTYWTFSNVECNVLFSFPSISAGSSASLVSSKVYFSRSTVVGNFIDVYPSGVLAVLMNRFLYCCSFGRLLRPFPFHPFLHRLELFSLVPPLPESFSSFSQSLTLSNRLSINPLPGSSLSSLLLEAIVFLVSSGYWVFRSLIGGFLRIVFPFEMLNSSIQLFTLSLLHSEYSSRAEEE